MKIYIKPSNAFYFDIIIGGESFFSTEPFVKKVELLNVALKNLESNIEKFAYLNLDNKYHHFFWEFTYDIHRDDGIKDTVADYYLLEIVKYLIVKYKADKIEVLCFLSKAVLKNLSKYITVEVKYSKKYNLKYFFRSQFGPMKYIKKYLTHALGFKKKIKKLPSDNNVFFLTNDEFSLARFRQFTTLMDDEYNVFLLNISLRNVRRYSNGEKFIISSYSLKSIFLSFFKTINLFRTMKLVFSKQSSKSIYVLKLKYQSFLQYYYLVLRQEALKVFFLKYKPKYVVVTTTIGDPINRMVVTMAKKHNIKTIVFSCRSVLSYLRAEDRVINLDFNKENGNFFTDYFISFDALTKHHLIKSGVDKNIIFTYNEVKLAKTQRQIVDGVLLLFAHSAYNVRLLESLELVKKKGINIKYLYYREHPSVKLTEEELLRLKKIFKNVICISNFAWVELNFSNVIALTSNSTSGIDACARGASVVWLPFLTEHSTQFKPMMDAVGKTCNNEFEFITFLSTLNGKKRILFNDNCKKQFFDNIYEESDIDEFFLRLKNG